MRSAIRNLSVILVLPLLAACTSPNSQSDLGGVGGNGVGGNDGGGNGGAAGGGGGGAGGGGSGGGGGGNSSGGNDLSIDDGGQGSPADLSSNPVADAAAASCTVPQDCTAAATPICCVMSAISTTTSSVSTSCTATCAGSVVATGTSSAVTTKACHADVDCAGYSGIVTGVSVPWTSCCSNQLSAVHFCGSAQGAAAGGYTCP